MAVKFLGIEERGWGPVALFDKGFINHLFTINSVGQIEARSYSEICFSRESLISRIKNIRRLNSDTSEEERALEALDKYQEVSK